MSSIRSLLALIIMALCATDAQAVITLENKTDDPFVKFWIRPTGKDKWKGPHVVYNAVYPINDFDPGVYDFLYLAKGRLVQNPGVKLQKGDVYAIRTLYGAPEGRPDSGPPVYAVDGDEGYGGVNLQEEVNKPDHPRLGVTCYKCDDGIHLKSVSASGPAANCRDLDGDPIRLEADDHIIEINGVAPQTYEHYIELIENSPRVASLLITDGGTGRRMDLTTELWSNRLRLGINGRKCRTGIHLDSVDANSPAINCRQLNGNGWHLESGEHILEVNGVAPATFQQFIDLIQASNRTVDLLILDKSDNRISLTTQLW